MAPTAALATYRDSRESLPFGPPPYCTICATLEVVLLTPSSPAVVHLTVAAARDRVGAEEKLNDVGQDLMVASTVLQSNTEAVLDGLSPMVADAPAVKLLME